MNGRISAILLVCDEELHIDRVISSLPSNVTEVVLVDSGSHDNTVNLARMYPHVKVFFREWVNYSDQFRFALSCCSNDWVLRIDADEYLTDEAKLSISELDLSSTNDISGFYIDRWVYFLGSKVRWGGVFPVRVLRLFDKRVGYIEDRWMDEHINVDGNISFLNGSLIDDNRKNSSWWIQKHNGYANREAFDYVLNKYMPHRLNDRYSVARFDLSRQDQFKRFLKESVYNHFPIQFRVYLYWIYRYYFRLGFLDKGAANSYHWFQGLWYRKLVDLRIREFELHYAKYSDFDKSVRDVFGIVN